MPLTASDLDSLTCNFCCRSLRAHCTEKEGAWFFTPCRGHLLSLSPKTWRSRLTNVGLCLDCSRDIDAHFRVETPSATVKLRSTEETIFAAGEVVIRTAVFVGCGHATQ